MDRKEEVLKALRETLIYTKITLLSKWEEYENVPDDVKLTISNETFDIIKNSDLGDLLQFTIRVPNPY